MSHFVFFGAVETVGGMHVGKTPKRFEKSTACHGNPHQRHKKGTSKSRDSSLSENSTRICHLGRPIMASKRQSKTLPTAAKKDNKKDNNNNRF